MSPSQPIPDKLGKYNVVKHIGSGGYADVYLVENSELDRREALKILKQQWLHDPAFVQNFKTEAKSAAKFQHPNIITIYEQGELNGRFYISVEYLSGGSLADRLKGGHSLSPQRTAEFIRQIASALDYAHQRKTIHRDVKPANILIRSDPRGGEQAVLADFGIAKAMQESSSRQSTTIVGTPTYLSPEQILHPGNIDERADIYALGVVAYQLLTGELPFAAGADESFIHLANLINKSEPPSLVEREQGFHVEIERAVFKALEKHPDDRYESAGTFAEKLDAAVLIWQQESGEEKQMVALSGMAVQAMRERHWDEAVKYWKQYLAIVPEGDTVAVNGLFEAEKQIKIRELRIQAQQSEAQQDWTTAIVALTELLVVLPEDQETQQKLARARTQQNLQILHAQVLAALEAKQWDNAIELSQQIEKISPEYQDIQQLRDQAILQKVTQLKDDALMAVGQRNGELALALVQQIRTADPTYQFCTKQQVEQIIEMADKLQSEAEAKAEAQRAAEAKERRKRLMMVGGAIILVLLLCAGGSLLATGRLSGEEEATPTLIAVVVDETATTTAVPPTKTSKPTATVINTPTQEATTTPTATATKKPTDVPTNTPTNEPSPTKTPRPTQTPELEIRLRTTGSASIFAGPGTDYEELGYVPTGTTAVILNRSQNGSWWRVDTGSYTGWITKNLIDIVGDADTTIIAVATPDATPNSDTPSYSTNTPTPPPSSGKPLNITANWPVGNASCPPDNGFAVDYWIQASGGNGLYTYKIDDQIIAQDVPGGFNYRIETFAGSFVGTLYVISDGATLTDVIFVSKQSVCDS